MEKLKIVIIKYKDPAVYTESFNSVEDSLAFKPRIIKAKGFYITKNEDCVFLAHTYSNDVYHGVMDIPLKAVIEITETKEKPIYYLDTRLVGYTVSITKEKIEKHHKPLVVAISGHILDGTHIAMEENEDGKYRTVSVIPYKFIKGKK